ncbi:hypothetical protein NB620_00330 [Vibrio alginolyticus]|uniref:hypothetical protein n=1 Tax=Vibrio alginolyticus TaxID=663 RepID=UPI00215C9FEC|nr:hypothetical protein [Vibrio alginolyticus]MCR9998711.1 hypothetical protein [Vibrio alginolyticus]
MSKKGFFDKLESTESNAALKEQSKKETAVVSTTKPKHLNAMPVVFFEAHKKGKNGGVTSLDFSQYIYEAVREKLQRDRLI